MKRLNTSTLLAATVCLFCCNSWQQSVAAADAVDTIYINGVVITVNTAQPYAEAFAVTGDRFVAVGTNDEIRRLAMPSTKIVDLKGMTVTPGFNDTHVHPHVTYPEDSPYWTPWLGPEVVKTMDELIAELKKKADRLPPGTLITGSRYQDCWLGRHPTRWDLDKVSTVHPIRISHSSGHVSVVNSFVMENSGITKDTPDPRGSYDRDPDGTPNGVLRAGSSVSVGATESAPRIPAAVQTEAYRERFREYARKGITSVGIAGTSSASRYETLRDTGTLVRMALMSSDSVSSLQNRGINYGHGDERLRYTAIKMFHGASFSGNTCWLSQPHVNRPDGRTDYHGIQPSRSQESLDRVIQEIHDAGFQVAVHSNGDREIDMTITAIERAQAKNPRPDARHRIEHASVQTMPLLERAKAAGIILIFHSYLYDHGEKLLVYEDRFEMIHPYRTAIDMGIYVASHSDSPIASADPLLRIHSLVNRMSHAGRPMGLSQRITVEEAIKVWTLDGAFTTFEEDIKGSITPGKLADFVVLRQDPRQVPPETIKDIIVDATYIGGVNAWQAPSE